MKIAAISILICSIGTVCFAIRPQVQRAPDEPTIIHGSIEAIEGSPVVLSDARYEVVSPASSRETPGVVGHVKIENVSGRPIKLLILRFAYKLRFSMSFVASTSALAPGESRDYAVENLTSRPPAMPAGMGLNLNGMTLTVMPTGAAFEGGSQWAAPRTESRPLGALCLQQAGLSYLQPREADLTNVPYTVRFEIVDPAIVAYRLGAAMDSPTGFETRLGEWVDVPGSERYRGARFLDSGQSLKYDQIFPENKDSAKNAAGAIKAGRPGVGTFVAEVRLGDGRVWRQSLTREDLLWNN